VLLILFKIHESQGKSVLAACDKELLGKKLEKGNICFEVKESFYNGETADRKELAEMLKKYSSINLVGEKVVGIALEENIAEEKSILMLGEVPHVQIFRI